MHILKNSEKYTVFKYIKQKKILVLKISNRKPQNVIRELNFIKKLKNHSNFFKKKIPKIINSGLIKKGINKNKGFYEMEFINGPTFSEVIQKNILNKNKLKNVFNLILNEIIDEIRGKIKLKKKNFSLFQTLIDKEYFKISKKELFKNLLTRKYILINNKKYLNISNCLKEIYNSKSILNLKKDYTYLSNLNHCNFHGGNIIFSNKKLSNFKIIDPDSSWKYNDPFFSVARLMYTYPHDTMEFDKYYILSKDFERKERVKPISFKIKHTWSKKIEKNYQKVFKCFFDDPFKKNSINQQLKNNEFLRLNLALVLCFLRGINANHQPKINFLTNVSYKFENKGLYLYLFFIIYLNNLKKNI